MVIPVCYNRKHHSVTAGAAMTADARRNASTTDRPMRSDARRNRERVLAAAEDVFAEMGLKAQVEEVARRAGVGVGTVCRHFPTKQALVEAVLEAMYESLLADARAALHRARPRCRVRDVLPRARRFQARHRALAEQMATALDLPLSAQPTREALRQAITRARRQRAAGRHRALRHRPGRHRACCSPVSRTRPRSRVTCSPCSGSATSRSSSTGCAR